MGHTVLCAFDLTLACFSAQLGYNFYSLFYACCPHRMSACFEAT